jgi:hypothetical protein
MENVLRLDEIRDKERERKSLIDSWIFKDKRMGGRAGINERLLEKK